MAWGRRLLIGGGVLAAGAGATWAGFLRESDYELGQARLMPPLLRGGVAGQDRIFVLVRRAEREIARAWFHSATPAERIELRGYEAATLAPVFASGLVSVPPGSLADARILGQRDASLWVFVGGIGAASVVDGRMLADQAGIGERVAGIRDFTFRPGHNLFFDGELEFTDAGRRRYRIDSRTFAVTTVGPNTPSGEGGALPTGWTPGGIARDGERRVDGTWFGLLDAGASGFDTRQIARAGTREARLWRAPIRPPGAPPAPAASPAVPGKPTPEGAASTLRRPSASPAGETLADAAPVAVEPGPILDAAFLPGTPMPLLLYRQVAGGPFRMARLGADGAVAWRAALPLGLVACAMPGGETLVLGGVRAGAARGGAEVLAAVNLSTGAVVARDLATDEAITA
ncbi:MAG TPA: hypothetical protein VD970_19775 [Acetobacteraceae bacterium]|nr:hypothetical protein [Acetobacteraceae bacterium]